MFINRLNAGLWTASYNFGLFLGATGSGFLVEAMGFRWMTVLFLSLYVLMFLVNMLDVYFRKRRTQERSGYSTFK